MFSGNRLILCIAGYRILLKHMHKLDYEFKMAETIVSPTGQSTHFWMHFGFKRDSSGKIDKSKHAICKLCNVLVAHGSGMTNLQSHLHLNHSLEYLLLCPPEEIVILPKWMPYRAECKILLKYQTFPLLQCEQKC